ncbi:histidine phosphatase family protein [Prochlorococcus marinus]|uniref:histidine phosphatase family protein n=1 Tax=Prochlorococcus marinus TaxID=1219 RepID=UPI0016504297|nr:histidine phosphatase family protein [Prochlorococcus marinus]
MDNKSRIKQKLFTEKTSDIAAYRGTKAEKKWANIIQNGGYILHFRHADRNSYKDNVIFDALESVVHSNGINGTRFAESHYFSEGTCLNKRGKVQARVIGEHMRNINVPIGFIITSPICRARQTASIAFGKYDEIDFNLVHRGPFTEDKLNRVKKLKKLYLSMPIEQKNNTIVSSHNGDVIRDIFKNTKVDSMYVDEGGFFVISRKNNELTLEHRFNNFNDFSRHFYPR